MSCNEWRDTELGLVPADWEYSELKDKVEVIMGQSPNSLYYNITQEGMPFLQGRKTFGEKFPTIDTWCTNPIKVAEKGDVLLSVRAPVGDLNIANQSICIGRGLASLKMKNHNNEFLYYLLKSYKAIIVGKQSGTVFGSINKNDIENLKLPFPPLNEQKAIAKILSNLDEKIEINNRINKVLEEIAQTIFKRWFIDFEFPNENGEPYKSSGGEMVESELGPIPKGWEVVELIDLSKDIITGKTPSTKDSENFGSFLPFVTIPDMHGKVFVINTERYLSKKGLNRNKVIPKGAIMVSCIATPGLVSISSNSCQTNQQINSIIPSKQELLYYLYLTLCNLSEYIKTLGSSGSTTLNLNKAQFSKIKLISPQERLVCTFDSIISGIFDNILKNEIENIKLMQLRDTLLPKLMSGEIRVDLNNGQIVMKNKED